MSPVLTGVAVVAGLWAATSVAAAVLWAWAARRRDQALMAAQADLDKQPRPRRMVWTDAERARMRRAIEDDIASMRETTS